MLNLLIYFASSKEVEISSSEVDWSIVLCYVRNIMLLCDKTMATLVSGYTIEELIDTGTDIQANVYMIILVVLTGLFIATFGAWKAVGEGQLANVSTNPLITGIVGLSIILIVLNIARWYISKRKADNAADSVIP